MADESAGSLNTGPGESKGKIVKVSPEDYSSDRKNFASLKVICLGDSAVGKSK